MNRNVRLALVLSLALGAAGAASFGVYRVVSAMPVREVEVASLQTVVAARPIPVGTIVTSDHVKLVPWPSRNPVPGSFTKIDGVVNRGAIVEVAQNEPLTETKLAPLGAGGGLPPTIPEGMRAISVKTNEVVGVAGFVIPGTRVDVLVIVGKGARDEAVSRAVVSNVQVLTAGSRFDQEKAKAEGKPIPATVVTLLVTPGDAEKISLAASEGQIMLTLRNPLDVAPTATDGVRMANLISRPAPPVVVKRVEGRRIVQPPPPAAAPAPAPEIYSVEAIRGAKRSQESVK
ncbi:MAG TPA: Flp pilus assembly protein CpaB [Vicinamibacterales bacterium]|nr:Flp pilus assembly protein CpaB [Vicinamibacterales bacterium]